jgi:hypothetical protein
MVAVVGGNRRSRRTGHAEEEVSFFRGRVRRAAARNPSGVGWGGGQYWTSRLSSASVTPEAA